MKMGSRYLVGLPLVLISLGVMSCANQDADPSKPSGTERKSLADRLSESGGYKQDADGNWVPKSDKRSAYDSQRDSPFSAGTIDNKTYKTGDYAKKSWWGTKDYETAEYSGNTDGSRFQTKARQDGQIARADGVQAQLEGPYKTNTLERNSARESSTSAIAKPANSYTENQQQTFKAPSVIDWREQRSMSLDRSKGILGR